MLSFMDVFVDELLTKERVCGTSLMKLPVRSVLEDLGQLEVRVSPLGEELDELDEDEGDVVMGAGEEDARVNGNGNGNRSDDSDSDG